MLRNGLRTFTRLPRTLPNSNLFSTTSAVLKKGGKGQPKVQDVVEENPLPVKGKNKVISTASLIPASQSKLSPEAQAEADKVNKKMAGVVEWCRKEMVLLENQALGRVTPAILDSVRVDISGEEGAGDGTTHVKLQDIATVGVKEGTVLVVTLFDEDVSLFPTLRLFPF